MRLLDTDVIVDIGRDFAPAHLWIASLTELPGVPNIVLMELLNGCANKLQLRQVQKLVTPYPIVWLNEADGRRALADFTQYRLSHSLGLTDALIAATAVGRGATLCTFNVKHFSVVPGLVTEQPYSRP